MESRRTDRPLPVLIGADYEHVMAHATIEEEPDHTHIVIDVKGKEARILAEFLTAPAPIALSFAALPVQPRQNHIKEP